MSVEPLPSSPLVPLLCLSFSILCFWYSTRSAWIRKAAEMRVNLERRFRFVPKPQVDTYVTMTRGACVLMGSMTMVIVVIWVVQALTGSLE